MGGKAFWKWLMFQSIWAPGDPIWINLGSEWVCLNLDLSSLDLFFHNKKLRLLPGSTANSALDLLKVIFTDCSMVNHYQTTISIHLG